MATWPPMLKRPPPIATLPGQSRSARTTAVGVGRRLDPRDLDRVQAGDVLDRDRQRRARATSGAKRTERADRERLGEQSPAAATRRRLARHGR